MFSGTPSTTVTILFMALVIPDRLYREDCNYWWRNYQVPHHYHNFWWHFYGLPIAVCDLLIMKYGTGAYAPGVGNGNGSGNGSAGEGTVLRGIQLRQAMFFPVHVLFWMIFMAYYLSLVLFNHRITREAFRTGSWTKSTRLSWRYRWTGCWGLGGRTRLGGQRCRRHRRGDRERRRGEQRGWERVLKYGQTAFKLRFPLGWACFVGGVYGGDAPVGDSDVSPGSADARVAVTSWLVSQGMLPGAHGEGNAAAEAGA